MKPYLDKGVFVKLKNKKFFNSVRVAYGTISWNGEIDICADTLYQTSEVYKDKTKEISKWNLFCKIKNCAQFFILFMH